MNLILIGYMISIYKEYGILAYPIISSFVIKDSSRGLTAHADMCHAPCGLTLWARPPLVAWPMYGLVGIRGYIPTAVGCEKTIVSYEKIIVSYML